MEYDGFISYSHAADGLLAPALQGGLQRLAKHWNSRRALRVFRDETGLSTNPHLWSAIEDALDESRWFVLLASPEAAGSEWVNKEISHWLATKSIDHILPVVTDGSWEWDPVLADFTAGSSAVPEALRGALHEEPRHLDLRWARDETDLDLRNSRFRSAVADLAAPMHGVAKDELEGEDVRQHLRTRRLARAGVSALVLLVLLVAGLGALALVSRNQAVVTGNTARAQALASESQNELSTDPEVSVLLAREAVEVSPIPLALTALREAIDASPVRLALPTESGTQCGHGGPALVYSPTGERIAESLCTGEVVVLDAATGHVIYRRHLADKAGAVAYDPSGRYLAVGTNQGIDLLDPADGSVEARLAGHGEPNALAFSHDGLELGATTDAGVTLWDLTSRTARDLTKAHNDQQTLAFTSDGQFLVVGTAATFSGVYSTATGQAVRALLPPGQSVASGQVSPVAIEGTTLVVAENVNGPGTVSADIDLWNTEDWTMERVLGQVTGTEVTSVAISPDGQRIAVGDADGTGSVWSVSPGEELVGLSGQTAELGTIAFSPTGADVAATSNDGTARIYRPDGPWLDTVYAQVCGCGTEIGWRQDRLSAFARFGNDAFLRTWTEPSGRQSPNPPLVSTDQQSFGAAISPDVRRVALWNDGAAISTVRVVDPTTLRVTFTLPATTVDGVAFSDDGRLLVVTDTNGDIYITTLSDGHTVVSHRWSVPCGPGGAPTGGSPVISPDDRLVAVYSFCGQVIVGKTSSARPDERFTESGQLSDVAFNPAGTRLALGSWDSTVTVLNLASDRPLFELVGHSRGVNGVAYSPNGRYIATTSEDDTLRVWDATTGQVLQIDHDQSGVGNPAFSPDSRMVAESNDDNQIRVWTVCADCQDPSALLRASDSSVVSPLTPLERAEAASQDG
ncbi:MAG: TIR domain-containing protein [Acidimicrobiales bacterium]